MSNPFVRPIGQLEDFDGRPVILAVDYDTVAIHFGRFEPGGGVRFSAGQQEEFARLFVAAVWQAGQQKREMAEDAEGSP